MTTTANTASKEVAKEANKSVFDDRTLLGITSIADAVALLNNQGVPSDSIRNYGSGFDILDTKDKIRLVGVPFVALEWAFHDGDNGTFVSVNIITDKGEKLILNDGSTGICKQFREITDQRLADGRAYPQQGLAVEKGLRVSEYDYEDKSTGELKAAKTFYLS